MPTPEVPLDGGNATPGGVVRLGDTVRKPWSASTPAVQDLLRRLRGSGLPVPRPLGRDDAGRQVLGYLPGTPLLGLDPDAVDLARLGALARSLHDAAPTPSQVEGPWEVLIPAPGSRDVIGHQDFAPWNVLLSPTGDLSVIDWDGAGPTTRPWDLAYTLQSFARLQPGTPPADAAERLRAIIDGYDADDDLRRDLPAVMATRTAAMATHLSRAASIGWQPWARMHADGHGRHWEDATAYVVEHEALWRRALT